MCFFVAGKIPLPRSLDFCRNVYVNFRITAMFCQCKIKIYCTAIFSLFNACQTLRLAARLCATTIVLRKFASSYALLNITYLLKNARVLTANITQFLRFYPRVCRARRMITALYFRCKNGGCNYVIIIKIN